MILDGDGCNPANTSDGQVSTRLQAFIEMLEKAKVSNRFGMKHTFDKIRQAAKEDYEHPLTCKKRIDYKKEKIS